MIFSGGLDFHQNGVGDDQVCDIVANPLVPVRYSNGGLLNATQALMG